AAPNTPRVLVHLEPPSPLPPRMTLGPAGRRTPRRTRDNPGHRAKISPPIQDNIEENISGINGQVAIKLFGDDLDALRRSAVEVKRTLEQVPGVADLAVVHSAELPQVHVVVDRKAIARYGLNIADVQDVVETAIGGQTATTL